MVRRRLVGGVPTSACKVEQCKPRSSATPDVVIAALVGCDVTSPHFYRHDFIITYQVLQHA